MQDIDIPMDAVSHVLMLAVLECRGCNGVLTAEMWIPTARGNYVLTCACGAEYRWTESAATIRCRLPQADGESAVARTVEPRAERRSF